MTSNLADNLVLRETPNADWRRLGTWCRGGRAARPGTAAGDFTTPHPTGRSSLQRLSALPSAAVPGHVLNLRSGQSSTVAGLLDVQPPVS